jgi:glutathione synthase/RimK-type ligase-like ATP-grasp enzyme
MSRNGIALVTAPRIDDHWHDDEIATTAATLRGLGVPTDVVAWYDDDVDWASYRLVVLRSPWDIYWHLDEFSIWLSGIEEKAPLLNPAETVAWNLDKRYLATLSAASVNIVPTTFIEASDPTPEFPGREFVIKPTTSAGALQTARYRPEQTDKAAAHIAQLHQKNLGVMLQPYVESIDQTGERCLIFVDGSFDHAIKKGAVLQRDQNRDTYRDAHDAHPDPKPYQPTPAEMELAMAALSLAPRVEDVLYTRVDIVDSASGDPAIMELEMVDPVMFFDLSEGSQERFAEAVQRRYLATG